MFNWLNLLASFWLFRFGSLSTRSLTNYMMLLELTVCLITVSALCWMHWSFELNKLTTAYRSDEYISTGCFLNFRYSMSATRASSPRNVKFGSLTIKNWDSKVYLASSNSSVSSLSSVAKVCLMISYSTLFANGFRSMSLNFVDSFGMSLYSTLLISQSNLTSLISSQFDFVSIIWNSIGIVTKKRRGLIIEIFWMAVTAEIFTDKSGSCNLSAKYGTNFAVDSGQWTTSL